MNEWNTLITAISLPYICALAFSLYSLVGCPAVWRFALIRTTVASAGILASFPLWFMAFQRPSPLPLVLAANGAAFLLALLFLGLEALSRDAHDGGRSFHLTVSYLLAGLTVSCWYIPLAFLSLAPWVALVICAISLCLGWRAIGLLFYAIPTPRKLTVQVRPRHQGPQQPLFRARELFIIAPHVAPTRRSRLRIPLDWANTTERSWLRDLLIGTRPGYLTTPYVYTPCLVSYAPRLVSELGVCCPWVVSLALVALLVVPLTGGSILWAIWGVLACLCLLGMFRLLLHGFVTALCGGWGLPGNADPLIVMLFLPICTGIGAFLLGHIMSFPTSIPWGFLIGSLAAVVFPLATLWRLSFLLPSTRA